MPERRTITVNSTPGDATKAAQEVAAAIQKATGKTVTIGEEYTQGFGHKAGMLSVDLTIEDLPEPTPAPTPIAEAHDAYIAERAEDLIAVGLASAENGDGPDLSLGPDSVSEDDPQSLPTSDASTRRQDKRRKAKP